MDNQSDVREIVMAFENIQDLNKDIEGSIEQYKNLNKILVNIIESLEGKITS